MSQFLFQKRTVVPSSLVVPVTLALCVALLTLTVSHRSVPDAPAAVPGKVAAKANGEQVRAPKQIVGEEARQYLQQPGEGQSLMQAIATARFGLQGQERGPFGEAGAGYLAMSHEQNLNAWFADDGVTVRPTVAEQEREHSWHMDMRLKAYGYGNELVVAPPIVSRQVKGNRIEYERSDCRLPIANCRFEDTARSVLGSPQSLPEGSRKPQFAGNRLFQLAIGNRQSAVTEWYENRAEGIEQGFIIGARPERKSARSDEPLRLLVSLKGELRAQVKDQGRAIELTDAAGKSALSYSKLMALDADGKQLAAHLEASAEGNEIALVVNDREATYPIVVDPIVASVEKILDAAPFRQIGAQFGDAVAIDGDKAIVGAWMEDTPFSNNGAVYMFSRVGSTWSFVAVRVGLANNDECGYGVAIHGSKAAWGCPGSNGNTGRAFIYDFTSNATAELIPDPAFRNIGEFFGAGVAISAQDVVVGAPFSNLGFGNNDGQVHIFSTTAPSYLYEDSIARHGVPNGLSGFGVAVEGDTIIVGRPGVESVDVFYRINGVWQSTPDILTANDGQAGDLFGDSVALSGNTAVLSAAGDDDKGTDAGAAYVFVRGANGKWSQQQKLTASDGKPTDLFSYFSIAIQGNTIVAGARHHDFVSSDPNDNRGAAYIFTRSGQIWTEQTKLTPGGFYRAAGDEFGTGVGISGNTVIVSAPHEAANSDGTTNAGVTYVYRLDCVPPSGTAALIRGGGVFDVPELTACPSDSLSIVADYTTAPGLSFQWRKDGVTIPGATANEYQIASMGPGDIGSYDVIVSNSCGGAPSTPATLGIQSLSINPSSQNFGASGSTGIVNVISTGSGCAWMAVSNAPFISITSGASGRGNGTVGFTVAANTGATRSGSVTIAGKTFSVTQDGAAVLVSNVQFSASNYSAGEGSNNATITVTRTGDTSGTVTVDFATSDLVAQQRTDYTITAGTLTFTPGQTGKTFDVLIVDDLYVEGSETLNLTLSNPNGGAVLGSPSTAVLTIVDNDSGSATTNPLDNADERFFVRQQFYDFLSRLPDQGGFDFWAGQITQCGTNQTCIRSKRLDVSNAFFFELEYQQTGAYVFRLYRAAFGNNQPFPNPDIANLTESRKLPSYAVFARDRARVVGGLSLAQSQLDLANAFVARAEFLAKYPASQDGPTFVDAILATIRNETGGDLTAQRTALINLFNTGGRGAVLYRLADDNVSTNPINNRAFIDAEYNRAFVATQYFGYLRRDSDIGGFLFWVGQVNSGPLRDTTKQHAMVCAFVTALEYQQRFSSVVTHSNAECQ